MQQRFLGRQVVCPGRVAWRVLGLLGLMLFLQCGEGEKSGSLTPPGERALLSEQQAVQNLLTLYQTALRQEDIDRLQELLSVSSAAGQTAAQGQPAQQPVALRRTVQSAEAFLESVTAALRARDLIDLQVLEPHIRLAADGNSVSFLHVESSVVGSGSALIQQTVAETMVFRLSRTEDADTVRFTIAEVAPEGPQFQVVTPGRALAGRLARLTVRETTGSFPIAAVEVEEPETKTVQTLTAAAASFQGLFTPPMQDSPQPLHVRIHGTDGTVIAFPHRYRLRLPDEMVVQPLHGTDAAQLSAVAQAPDGTIWAGGREAPARGGVLYSVLPGDTAVTLVGNLLNNPAGDVTDLVFDQLGRLHAVVYAGSSETFEPVSAVIVRDQNVFCRTVNAYDFRQSYPFKVRDRNTGAIVRSPSTRAVAATGGNIWLHASDGGVALVADTFRQGYCPENGIAVRYDPIVQRPDHPLPANSVPAFVVGARQTLWFGTALGLTRRREGQFTPVPFDPALSFKGDPQTLEEFLGELARAIFEARPITTVRIQGVAFVQEFGAPLLKADLIFTAVEDSRQRLWAGTLGAGIRRIEVRAGVPQETLYLTRQDGLSSNVIFALAVGLDGSIWAATEEGVSRIRERHGTLVINNFTALDGLALPVRDVVVDRSGIAWLATDGGLFRIMPQGGLIRGVVHDTAGRVVAGVDVSVLDTPFQTATDAAGHFVLAQLPFGTHVLQFVGPPAAGAPLLLQFQEITITAREQTASIVVALRSTPLETLRLAVLSGHGERGTVGKPLTSPLTVEVHDGTGMVVSGLPVTFTVSQGDGVVSVSTALTDALGQARTLLTPGIKAGANVVQADLLGLPAQGITVTGQADRDSARLLEVRGNNQAGAAGQELPAPLVVRLADQFDNPLVGEMVTASVRNGLATFALTGSDAADSRTNEAGEVEFTVQLGDEAAGVLIEVTALQAAPVQFLVPTVIDIAPFGYGLAVLDDGSLLVLYALTHQLLLFPPESNNYNILDTTLAVTIPAELVRAGPDSVIVGDQFPAALHRVDLTDGSHAVLSGCASVDSNEVCTSVIGAGSPSLNAPVALAREAGGSILLGDGRPDEGTSPPRVIRVHPETGDREFVSGCQSLPCTQSLGTGPAFKGVPEALAVEASGAILVGDTGLQTLFRVDPHNGNRTIISGCTKCAHPVGSGPPLELPQALAVEAQGTILVAEAGYATRALLRVNPHNGDRTVVSGCADSTCSTMRGTGPAFSVSFPDAIAVLADGAIVAVDRGLGTGVVLRVDPLSGARKILFLLRP